MLLMIKHFLIDFGVYFCPLKYFLIWICFSIPYKNLKGKIAKELKNVNQKQC